MQYVILRYANVFGPRQSPHGEAGVVAIFTDKMLKGEKPIINGDGKQTRDFIFVSDVVQANLLALNYSKSDIFNIGTGIENDVNTLFHHLNKFTGANCKEEHAPAKAGEQLRSVIDYTKAKKLLGWQPKISFENGLQQTVEFFKKKLNHE